MPTEIESYEKCCYKRQTVDLSWAKNVQSRWFVHSVKLETPSRKLIQFHSVNDN